MKYLVTGGCGFIGSCLALRLIEEGHEVMVFDNLSSGNRAFLKGAEKNKRLKIVEGDLLKDHKLLTKVMNGIDFVFHLAANPDIRGGITDTKLDFEQGTVATYNVLEAARKNKVKKIAFSSSSVVYGEATTIPTPENYGPLFPISLYGASKLASEGLVTSYCSVFNMQSWIYRFANIVGKNDTHGILVDFVNKLKINPKELEVLGNGEQKKSYLLVEECVDAMLYVMSKSNEQVNCFNLGCDDQIKISDIANLFIDGMKRDIRLRYTGGDRGWVGDVPQMLLDTKKINALGWKARHNSREAIKKAISILVGKEL